MPRRRRRPHKNRFVRYLGLPLSFAAVLIVPRMASAVACWMLKNVSPSATCPQVGLPWIITAAMWLGIVVGLGLAGRQWYRDHVMHDYLLDDD